MTAALRHRTMGAWRAALLVAALCCGSLRAQELRLGIIGTDSTHATEFTRLLNDATAKEHVTGARVVAVYRGGNPALDLSRNRIEGITAQLTSTWKLPLVAHIQDLCPIVDGLLLLSVDPSLRQQEFQEALACGKPVFVDKPLAPDLRTAERMAKAAQQAHVPWFSASSLRFGPVGELRQMTLRGADVWGPGALRGDYALDLAWYGIHSIEMLYGAMGAGAQSVSRVHTKDCDVLTIVWGDGRVGVVHLVRPDMAFGIAALTADGRSLALNNVAIDYAPLLREIVAFVRDRKSPTPAEETLEEFALMDAAQRSSRAGGVPMAVAANGAEDAAR